MYIYNRADCRERAHSHPNLWTVVQAPVKLACLWTVWGNQKNRSDPTQAQGEHLTKIKQYIHDIINSLFSYIHIPILFFLSFLFFSQSLICLQDQYQYLYKTLLGLVSTKDNTLSLLARNINGTMMSLSNQSNQTGSMESLVWEKPFMGPKQSYGSKQPARSLSPEGRHLTL